MTGVLPHYKSGPASKQVAGLIFGGQFVMPNTQAYGTTDFTVKLATATSPALCEYVLGCAGNDANTVTTQTGAANSYGQPQIDISVLTDYIPVYYGDVDIYVWYSGAVVEGTKLIIGSVAGTVITAGVGPAADQVVGMCTHPGGVSAAMLTQQIGGQGSAAYFLGRARIF